MVRVSTTRPLRIVIAGGGTGGHVFPALAIEQAMVARAPDARVIFAGTRHGLEARVVPQHGKTLRTLWIAGFARGRILSNVLLPIKLVVSLMQSWWLLITFRPNLVIGTGGYVMGPVLWTAQRLGIPTLLQEQNSLPGYTSKKLAPRAAVVCIGFEDARAHLKSQRIEVTGNPLRVSFHALDRAAARAAWPLMEGRPTLLVFGGSAGARSINRAVGAGLPRLIEMCNVIWQTGKLGLPDTVSRDAVDAAVTAKQLVVREFIDDMPSAYAATDLALCRAGAITLAELAMAGLPAILVPYPFAADDHQTANANSFVTAGAAILVRDAELSADTLIRAVAHGLSSDTERHRMSEAVKSLARPDAAARIAEIALSIANRS